MIKNISVEVKQFDLLVEYEYQPVEPTNYSIEAPYPGADESVSIESVKLYHTDENIRDLLSEEILEEITKQILTFELEQKRKL
jgi:hypothetical protein